MESKNNALDIVQEILELHVQYPNDQEFGGEVRKIMWNKVHGNTATY